MGAGLVVVGMSILQFRNILYRVRYFVRAISDGDDCPTNYSLADGKLLADFSRLRSARCTSNCS